MKRRATKLFIEMFKILNRYLCGIIAGYALDARQSFSGKEVFLDLHIIHSVLNNCIVF